MAQGSGIEWCDHTFNPWWGCTKVSPACTNCYAEALAKRFGHDVWGKSAPRRFFGDKHWEEPLKWNRAAEKAGSPALVFCASMADVFELYGAGDGSDPQAADIAARQQHARGQLGRLIWNTPYLCWLLLTKRPENWRRAFIEMGFTPPLGAPFPPPNIWVGVTAENQERADARIPELLRIPCAVRFVSYEPALGPVDLAPSWADYLMGWTTESEHHPRCDGSCRWCPVAVQAQTNRLDWVIAGGESGSKARQSSAGWYESVRDQCAAADVPFFMKQITSHGKKIPFDQWRPGLQVRQFPVER